MLQGHFIDTLLAVDFRDTSNLAFQIWQYFRGITAPVFFTISGLIFTYLLIKANANGTSNERIKKGIVRGLMLIGIGYALRIPVFRWFSGNFDTYFFGTSTATVYYPNDLKKININSFNVSFSAGNVSEHLTYLNWIIKNKLTPKRIYLELRDHSLLNINYKVSMHPDLLSFFLKAKFYLTDFSTFKFIIKKFISYDKLIFKIKKIADRENIIIENEERKLSYVLTGARYYQSYFDRKDNKNLQESNEKNIINDNFVYLDYEIDDNKMSDLKKISEICELNNIDYKFFLSQGYKS